MTPLDAVTWHDGSSPEALIEAFAAAAFTVAVIGALLDEPDLRKRAINVLQGASSRPT